MNNSSTHPNLITAPPADVQGQKIGIAPISQTITVTWKVSLYSMSPQEMWAAYSTSDESLGQDFKGFEGVCTLASMTIDRIRLNRSLFWRLLKDLLSSMAEVDSEFGGQLGAALFTADPHLKDTDNEYWDLLQEVMMEILETSNLPKCVQEIADEYHVFQNLTKRKQNRIIDEHGGRPIDILADHMCKVIDTADCIRVEATPYFE